MTTSLGAQSSAARAPTYRAFEPHEYVIAIVAALAVQIGVVFALRAGNLEQQAMLPDIDKGTAIPVKVTPVLDLDSPLLKLGGKRNKAKLPDRWVRQAPVQRVERKAFVSTQAGKTADDIPPPEVKIADAGTDAPPPDADVALEVDTEVTDATDAGPANVDQEGSADGVAEGTETDPLKARAVDLYRARIASWFQGRFRVTGSGLPKEELTKLRVSASVTLSNDRFVVSYSLSSSGNAVFDAAARATLEGAKGDQIPPPPANYPDTVQNQINLSLVCKDQCN